MTKQRAKNISQAMVASIRLMLDEWEGELTWQKLIAEIANQSGQIYTRQALNRHVGDAFSRRKGFLLETAKASNAGGDPKLVAALKKVSTLEVEKVRLENENKNLLEKFVRWAYNAHTRGIGPEILDRPLPARIEEGKTVIRGKKNNAKTGATVT